MKETPATPIIGKNPASGVSTAAYAIRVQPKPPKGIREYAYSIRTQQQAAASGHQESRLTTDTVNPRRPKNRAMKMISSAAIQVPRTCSQLTASISMVSPNRYPSPKAATGREAPTASVKDG